MKRFLTLAATFIIGIGTGDNREDGRPDWRRYDCFSVRLVRDSEANQTIEHKNQ